MTSYTEFLEYGRAPEYSARRSGKSYATAIHVKAALEAGQTCWLERSDGHGGVIREKIVGVTI